MRSMDDFELRKDWDERKQKHFGTELMSVISATDLPVNVFVVNVIFSPIFRNKIYQTVF